MYLLGPPLLEHLMRYLLFGSFAYDTILLHAGRFDARILPEALTRLNVSFGVGSVQEEFGGNAGNIAYNAAIIHHDTSLGTEPVWPLLVGTLGDADAAPYLARLSSMGHDVTTLKQVEGARCAHAWIMTDQRNNQITAFSSGPMAAGVTVPPDTSLPQLWHIAPEAPLNMSAMAALAIEKGATFFFDAGPELPVLLDGVGNVHVEIETVLERAEGIFVNDYEAALLEQKTGRTLASWVTSPTQFVIRTLGGEGVELIAHNGTTRISVAKAETITDPTGCGDAFRAGFIHAWLNRWPLVDCARLGAAMGSFAVETSGGQKHVIEQGKLAQRLATVRVLEAPVPYAKAA
jgi:adenosine kinase